MNFICKIFNFILNVIKLIASYLVEPKIKLLIWISLNKLN